MLKNAHGPVGKIMDYANVSKSEVDGFALVEGSARTSKVQIFISEYSGDEDSSKSTVEFICRTD